MATTTERAAAIRAELKRLGFGPKQVSVRSESYSMGSSIHIKVRSPQVRLSVVKAIAEKHEDVRRCESSGEILSGGNRFVFCDYSEEAYGPLAAAIQVQLHEGNFAEGRGVEVGANFVVFCRGHEWKAERKDGATPTLVAYSLECMARRIAIATLDSGAFAKEAA